MTQTESKTFLKKNKQEISAPKTKSPIEKISPVKSSVQKAESTLPVIKEQTMPPETVMFNSPAEIVEKETSVELDESQNYLSNIQFNFKGDLNITVSGKIVCSFITGKVLSAFCTDDFTGDIFSGNRFITHINTYKIIRNTNNISTNNISIIKLIFRLKFF